MSRRHVTARTTIVVGEFDGMHLGHRALVAAARLRADHDRQPLIGVVLDDDRGEERLSTVDERLRALLGCGCASAIAVTCDLRDRSERSWRVADRIADMTRAVGAVFSRIPGHSGQADFPSVQSGLRRAGIDIVEVDRLTDHTGAPIAGGTIRAALRLGRVEPVATWLGRPYELRGVVVHGSGLGRTIGFATANVDPPSSRVDPGTRRLRRHGRPRGRPGAPGCDQRRSPPDRHRRRRPPGRSPPARLRRRHLRHRDLGAVRPVDPAGAAVLRRRSARRPARDRCRARAARPRLNVLVSSKQVIFG